MAGLLVQVFWAAGLPAVPFAQSFLDLGWEDDVDVDRGKIG